MEVKVLVSLLFYLRQVEEYFLPQIIQEVTGQVIQKHNKLVLTLL